MKAMYEKRKFPESNTTDVIQATLLSTVAAKLRRGGMGGGQQGASGGIDDLRNSGSAKARAEVCRKIIRVSEGKVEDVVKMLKGMVSTKEAREALKEEVIRLPEEVNAKFVAPLQKSVAVIDGVRARLEHAHESCTALMKEGVAKNSSIESDVQRQRKLERGLGEAEKFLRDLLSALGKIRANVLGVAKSIQKTAAS